MAGGPQSWSIIVFGLNERETVTEVVERVQAVLQAIATADSEVVIVDDGSTDGSREVHASLAKRYPNVKVICHPRNLGIGEALRSGYAAASGENCSAVPADGQFDCDELRPFARVEENSFVSFYRPRKADYPGLKKKLSNLNRFVNRKVLGVAVKDVNWVKIYKTKAIRSLQLEMHSALVESEICAKLLLLGHRLVEAESHAMPRRFGESKSYGLKTILDAALELTKLAVAIRRFAWKTRASRRHVVAGGRS
jgi:dolichol-phosphate mannosyltransferase